MPGNEIQRRKWFLKDFVRTYQAYSRQGIEYKGHLAGQIETDNSARGYDNCIPEPLAIGAQKRSSIGKRYATERVELKKYFPFKWLWVLPGQIKAREFPARSFITCKTEKAVTFCG